MKKLYKYITTLIMILCIVGIVYSTYHIVKWYKDISVNKTIIKDINKHIEIVKIDDSEVIKIDFKSLKEQNPDTVGYIKINNTNIDYIVVQGEDNEYYLKHNFNKEWNIAGWVYADYKNRFDENDKNIVIFGHDTKDGSMFGTLKNTQDINWQSINENQIITFVTEMNQYKYQIFSTYIIEPEEYYITTDFNSDEDFKKFINTTKSRSTYNYNVDVTEKDKVLTLSSCTTSGAKRVVVHAKLIEKQK